MTEETLKRICNVFIGDEGDCYYYKTGAQLVRFFNEYLGTTDVYKNPFPSRWIYVYNKLVELIKDNRINDFFSVILSKQYILLEQNCTEVEALERIEQSNDYINKILSRESYLLMKKGEKYYLIKRDDDLELIGSGGFANVYFQKSTGLVIKKLKEDFWGDQGIRSRFKREYNITKELGNLQGIITVFDFDESKMSYTMEKAEITFDKFLSQNELDDNTKINCIRIILSIMKNVHESDVIHRDLSPNNIFIFNGQIKIADFGLGKDLNMFTSYQTIHTNAVGQYYYCAPEQFMMLRDGDKRSDVYSLGRIINCIMTGDPIDSHHVFRNVSEKATNSDAAYRYNDGGQLLAAFEKSVAYNSMHNRKEIADEKIKQLIFDEDVENYIYEMNAVEICRQLIYGGKNFGQVLLRFMNQSDEQGQHIIQAIDSVFREECKTYESYDPIALFANAVLQSKFTYTIIEIAASILNYIAYSVNRFSAQRMVEHLIDDIGVEPMIEDVLKA